MIAVATRDGQPLIECTVDEAMEILSHMDPRIVSDIGVYFHGHDLDELVKAMHLAWLDRPKENPPCPRTPSSAGAS